MHFWTKSCDYGLAGAAALAILVFTGLVPAHSQSGPKPELGMQLAQAEQTQPVPAQAPEPQSIWGVSCDGTLEGLDCRAVQSVQVTETTRVTAAVRMPPGATKPVMMLLVPSGINLTNGVTLQFGQDPAKRVRLQTCDGTGCAAEYAITEGEIAALSKGQPIRVSIEDTKRRPVSVDVPSTGFAAAYAKMMK